ncbi:high mobility group protein DSP1-like isoform X1, partial [Dinothrombium tinctorium]
MDSQKPKDALSAYSHFVFHCKRRLDDKCPDSNIVLSLFSRECYLKWNSMTEEEKEPFYQLEQDDYTRYQRELEIYMNRKNEQMSNARKAEADRHSCVYNKNVCSHEKRSESSANVSKSRRVEVNSVNNGNI